LGLVLVIGVAWMLPATAMAAVIEKNGGATASPGSLVFTSDPGGSCYQYSTNDVFVWNDQHVNFNPPASGVGAYWVTFTVDLYEWNGGARGAWLAGAQETLGPTGPGQTKVNTQTVQATYTGWNGDPSCWTFEVFRTMSDSLGGFAQQSLVW
jgi:hypothetical protein